MNTHCSVADRYLPRIVLPPVRRAVSIVTVMHRAASIYEVSRAGLIGKRKFAELVRCRALITWALRSLRPDLSYTQIGQRLGRDHTTIINLHRKAVSLRVCDAEFDSECAELMGYFQGDDPWWQ